MRRSSLPHVKENLIVTPPSVRFAHSPNVSRSWESQRDIVVRAEQRLARLVGDRGQERKVLDWCKKHNVNVIRKLPKLDSTILTSRGMNTEKFMSLVDEAKMLERGKPVKSIDHSSKDKERTPSAERTESFCESCQRELPNKRQLRQKPTFFTSRYECAQCGASNETNEDSNQDCSKFDSESNLAVSESVQDTIRQANPGKVIDHRNFSEKDKISENMSEKCQTDEQNDEGDIFWRKESDFDSFVENFERNMHFNDDGTVDICNETIFLNETSFSNYGNKFAEVKMAWDDDSSHRFAEVRKTIATDDGMEANDVIFQRTDDVMSQNYDHVMSQCNNDTSNKNSFISLNTESNSKILEYSNWSRASEPGLWLIPSPPSHNSPRSSPRNHRFSDNYRNRISAEVNVTVIDGENTNDSKDMTQSPMASLSVGLSRVALMRLCRESRARTKRASTSSQQPTANRLEPRSYLYDAVGSYPYIDVVSPEIKSVNQRHDSEPDSSDPRNS